MTYQRRTIDDELDALMPELAAIAIDGARAVGKTSTALERAASVVRLDAVSQRAIVEGAPESVLARPRPLLLDEWQQVPAVWDVVRRAVDADQRGGQFLLTGSASPAPGATAHTGAGRIARLRMRPMTLAERGLVSTTVSLATLLEGRRAPVTGSSPLGLNEYVEAIARSGFPAMTRLGDRARSRQLDSYLMDIVDRDVPDQGLMVRRPEALLAWLRSYAAATSSTAGYNTILDAATPGQSDKPARSTTEAYREVLTRLWLLDPVPAWVPSGEPFARLGAAPKHHLVDPALALELLGLTRDALLDGEGAPLGPQEGTMVGRLFESLATLCVRVAAHAAQARVGHLRTRNGDHEIDLVVVRRDGRVLAVKVKLAGAANDGDVRHVRWLADRIGPRLIDAVVLTTGPEAYRRRDGVAVVPLALLGP